MQLDTGINSKTLGGYENNVSEPDVETLNTLANYYEVTVDWLSGNTNNSSATLSTEELELVNHINYDDEESFIAFPMFKNGQELSAVEKRKVFNMARILLEKDR
ncbi:HTH-type transcriptional regulator Xre [compost metagenome]